MNNGKNTIVTIKKHNISHIFPNWNKVQSMEGKKNIVEHWSELQNINGSRGAVEDHSPIPPLVLRLILPQHLFNWLEQKMIFRWS
jgi:hypothetical protein